MVNVILRDGRVLKYNDVTTVSVHDGIFSLEPNGKTFFTAKIPIDIVERVEWNKPCRILKESRDRKRMKSY